MKPSLIVFLRRLRGCLLVLLLCGSGPGLAAAELRFLAWDEGIAAKELDLLSAGQRTPVVGLHPLQRSKPLSLPPAEPDRQRSFRLLARETVLPEGELNWETIPHLLVDVPAGLRQPLVILLPSSRNPIGLRSIVIEDATDDFPWGQFRIVNTVERDLILATREQRLTLPGNWVPVNFSLGDGGNRSVVIAIEEDDGGITIVYSTIWLDDPRSRRLVFIAPSENARLGAIMLKVVPEFRRD